MSHNELIAIEKLVQDLRLDFPIIYEPHGFDDEVTKILNAYVQGRIDNALDKARTDWEASVNKEALNNG